MNNPEIYNKINSIFDLKCKKYDYFKNHHFIVKNDQMYISSAFAEYLNGGAILLGKYRRFYKLGEHHVFKSNMYKIDIYIYKNTRFVGYNYIICGKCGSFGYNGLEQSTRCKEGVMVKRKVNKYLIEEYLNSNLARLEKIKKITNRIKNEKKE